MGAPVAIVMGSQSDWATMKCAADALDKLGIIGQCYKIKPRDTDFRMAGRAWTLKYGPAGKPCGTVGDYIDDVAPGSVIVLDNNGRDDCTVWGDILTEIAHRRGIAGTVINGINRDTHLCLSLGYPIFSKDSWMLNYIEKYPIHASQEIISQNESTVLIHLNLEIDQEVESFFLRYAQEIRVLEPKELVEKIKMGLEKGMEVYN